MQSISSTDEPKTKLIRNRISSLDLTSDDDDLIVSFRTDEHEGANYLLENTSIPIATIKKTFTYYGFTLFLIEVDQGIEKWTILRRYSWFRSVYTQLLKSQIIADTIDFPPIRFFNSLGEDVVEERIKGLQSFLDFICNHSLSFQCVCGFLLPIRKLITLEEEQGTILSSRIRLINFIDPNDTRDCKFPEFKIRGTLDTFPSLNSFFDNIITYPEVKDELLTLRLAVAPFNKKQNLTEIEKLIYEALLFRLRSIQTNHSVDGEDNGSLSV
jgi:hypothetical protein